MNNQPPKLPLRFLRWFCHPDLLPSIEGDLIELYKQRVAKGEKRSANWLFALEAIKLFRPSIIRQSGGTYRMNHYGMFKNNLRSSYRFLGKHRLFTLINLVGLSVGVLVAFYSWQYVEFEMSYDAHHEHADRIYRMETDIHAADGIKKVSATIPAAPVLEASIPEIQKSARVILDYAMIWSSPESAFREDYAYVDPSIFSVFTIKLLQGNPKTVLSTASDAVLSETAAIKYFGTTDCVGKKLNIDGQTELYVTGLMRDMPQNSHFRVDVLLHMKLLSEEWNPKLTQNWKYHGCYSYFLMDENSDMDKINQMASDLVNQNIPDQEIEVFIALRPLRDLYLKAEARGYRTGASDTGDLDSIWIVGLIGLFVLVIASFNFINLSMALSMNRVKEVGIRKFLGAGKLQLIWQLLMDSLLVSALAFVVSAGLLYLTASIFNELVGKVIINLIFFEPFHLLTLLGLSMGVGLLSGLYPAYRTSKMVIKGKTQSITTRKSGLSDLLISTQFITAIFSITFSIGIYQQLKFMQEVDVGYDKENKIALDFFFDDQIKGKSEYVKRQLLKIPAVTEVSFSSTIPGHRVRSFETAVPSAVGELKSFDAGLIWIDPFYLDQYDIEIVAGRNFNEEIQSDVNVAIIINETAVRQLGYTDPLDVIGKSFDQGSKGTVIGVVKDFHNFSLREEIKPLSFRYRPGRSTWVTVTTTGHPGEAIALLKEKWNVLGATRPFDYVFLDEAYERQYAKEKRLSNLALYFAFIAVFIANLGLMGLAAFYVSKRTKEIGIRKVLGSSSWQLTRLISGRFMKPILISLIVAVLVSNLALNNWLESFAYRTAISWELYVLTGVSALMIAFVTLLSQISKIVFNNPVDALRDE